MTHRPDWLDRYHSAKTQTERDYAARRHSRERMARIRAMRGEHVTLAGDTVTREPAIVQQIQE